MAVKELSSVWNARDVPRYRLRGVVIDHAGRHKIDGHHVARFLDVRGLSSLYDPARVAPRRRSHWWQPQHLANISRFVVSRVRRLAASATGRRRRPV
jgi:hypothetical protein